MKNLWMLGAVMLLIASCGTGTDPTADTVCVNADMVCDGTIVLSVTATLGLVATAAR